MLFCDSVILEHGTGKVTLVGTYSGVAAETFPSPPADLHIYIQLTSSVGQIPVRLSCLRASTAEPEEVYSSSQIIHFRAKLIVEQVHVVWKQFQFPAPGEYSFQLWSQGRVIAERRLSRDTKENTHEQTQATCFFLKGSYVRRTVPLLRKHVPAPSRCNSQEKRQEAEDERQEEERLILVAATRIVVARWRCACRRTLRLLPGPQQATAPTVVMCWAAPRWARRQRRSGACANRHSPLQPATGACIIVVAGFAASLSARFLACGDA
jgi:hypothetical protein